MIKAALGLASRGLAVFPCKPRDKIPLTKHGCLDATAAATQVRAWWTQWPDANIGLATGAKSGVWVLDIDGEDGEASLRDLELKCAKLPATIEAITGGGGRHLFFRLPDFDEAPAIRNSTAQLGAGLDVRGEGGYVIAPPSVHPSGKRYSWSVNSAAEFADAPVWLIAQLVPPDDGAPRPAGDWARIAKGVPKGQRNETAASLAGKLLRAGFRPDVTLELMLGWNLRNDPPEDETRIVRTVESIAVREMARRRP